MQSVKESKKMDKEVIEKVERFIEDVDAGKIKHSKIDLDLLLSLGKLSKIAEAYGDLTSMIISDKEVYEIQGKKKEAEAFSRLIEEIEEIEEEHEL
jgi:hypothetical protein